MAVKGHFIAIVSEISPYRHTPDIAASWSRGKRRKSSWGQIRADPIRNTECS